jgi:hypothetical protein
MKKRSRTYLLLGSVLIIWAILGFRIVKTIGPSTPDEVVRTATTDFVPPEARKRDTFSILADYRDPFLGTMPKKARKKLVKRKAPPKPVLPEIQVRYSGWINDSSSGQKIFFVEIDGEQLMMTRNQKHGELKLLSGNKDKIRVRYNGRTKTIKKSE